MSDREVNQSARWVFTINNYSADDLTAVRSVRSPLLVVYGVEKGAQGTPHLQGYVEHMNGSRLRRSQVEKALGGRAWLSVARGDEFQAVGYCVKDGAWGCNLVDVAKYLLMKSFIDKHRALNSKCTSWLGVAWWNAFYSEKPWFDEWDTESNVRHLYDEHVHASCEKCKCKQDFCQTCYLLSQF